MPSPVGELLAALARALAGLKVPWYLFGAQAAILHGAARLTADVDITLRLRPPATIETLVRTVERHGFRQRTTDPGFIERTRVVPLVHEATSIPVDAVGGEEVQETSACHSFIE